MWSLEFGGIERLVLDLCRCQRELEQSPSVLVATKEGRLAESFAHEQIAVQSAELRSGYDLSRDRVGFATDAMCDTEVVHFHVFTPAFACAATKTQASIVYTEHGSFGLGRQRTWSDLLKAKWKSRFVSRTVDFLSFNSQFTREYASRCMRFPSRSGVVYNGIDLQRTGTRTGELCGGLPSDISDAFVVGTSSRFAGFKRVDRLIRAFSLLSDRENCWLLLVGDGPLRKEYVQLATALGVRNRTVFTGFQSNVADYQALMDVCVFPSECEPFGLVAVEAMSLGKPTIVMQDGGGITEVVGSLSPEDVVDGEEGLAMRIEQYFRAKIGGSNALLGSGESRRRVEHASRFDIRRMAREFKGIYQTLPNAVEVSCA